MDSRDRCGNVWTLRCSIGGLWLLISLVASSSAAQSSAPRQWSDASGAFKVTAQLVEVKDGAAFLKTDQGKLLKIPVERLSQADQQFLQSGSNPFEEVDPGTSTMRTEPAATASAAATAQASSEPAASVWGDPFQIDWDAVEELDRSVPEAWSLQLPTVPELDFGGKRTTLAKKNNFFEDIRRLEVNPIVKRAVAGFTVSFSVPKPQSRLSLIDLASGKAVHTSPVEADMCPLALLNDGSTVLMYGTSDERKGFETHDQIQLWKITGQTVVRSPIWVPFPNESEHFGKKINSHVVQAIPVPNNKLILLGGNGHLACVDVATRKPFWHARLSNVAIDASVDGSLLAVLDGQAILIVDPQTGTVKSSVMLEDKPHVGWPKLRISPSGTRLLLSFTTQMRVLDLATGQWLYKCSFDGPPIAPNSLGYPHDDYALLENRLLVHLPSQIKVCEYRDAGRITVVGGTSFIGIQGKDNGLVVPAKIPHPAAEEILVQAQKDPSVFLIHPGVEVSIDA
ncbi:MAG: SHD1 domain-containing protein, partial [Planctomycetaceae bacterium]